jgi:putative endopeptidase
MDEAGVEQAGTTAIQPLLAKARKIKSWKQIGPMITELHTLGIFPVFKIDIDQDFKDTALVTTYLEQGGLGLPDRDYYLKDDDKSKQLRDAYSSHVERMMALAGLDPKTATQASKSVMKIETGLAKVSKTRVEMRNIQGIYNKIDRKGLKKTFKNIDWKAYFAAQGVPALNDISVSSVRFFEGANGLMKRGTPKQWGHYLQWTIVRSMASTLPKAFVDEQFTMTQALTGQKEQRPRWKRCAQSTDAALPDYVSQAFIKTMFPPDAKKDVETMVHGISDAFAAQVGGYDWMDDATKKKAIEKRDMMAYLIGYPSEWKVYDFELDAAQYGKNVLAARKFKWAHEWAKTTKPVDRNEWLMSSPTVNAYYHPLRNHMVYPAGILQPPFYNQKASLWVNLGGLGMIVGHELTHGFDDQGSQFAGNGALENWWSPDVGAKFKEKTQCVVEQYNGFEPIEGVNVNGQLTLGENIADLGGVKLAFAAYRKLREGKSAEVVAEGFTEDQQFFLAVGQAWCTKSTDEITRMLVQTDSHSPPQFRVNGSLSNLPEFAEAFECKKGTPMNRENICTVW